MILPDKLDQLVIECMKELHSIIDDDYRKDCTNVLTLDMIPTLYLSNIPDKEEVNKIILKYINKENLSLKQKISFNNLIKSFLV